MWMLVLFGLLVVGQGALRKWFLPGLSTPLYVAKDVALLGALLLFGKRLQLARPLRQTFLPVLWGGLTLFVVVQSFNLNVTSLFVSLIGAKSYLLYTMLMVLLPIALQRIERPERVVVSISLGVVVPVLLLGFYQYNQPVDAWINQYVADDAATVGVLSHPRITGTFSYIGGMGAFLLFASFFAFGIFIAGLLHKHRLYRWLGGGLLALALMVAPMNGSRGVVLGLLVPLPFVIYVLLRSEGAMAAFVILGGLTLVGGYVATQASWASQGWETVGHRLENASDSDTRVQSMLEDPFRKAEIGGLLGYGTGVTHQAAARLSSEGRINVGVGYEGELGRILIELGVVGTLFFLALKVWLAWFAWQAMNRARSAWETLLSVAAFCNLFLAVGFGMVVFNHTAGSLYWICAGCAVWVWSRQEERQRCRQVLRRVQRQAPVP